MLLEVTVGTKGMEGLKGTEGPRGMVGPSGTGLLTAVLVKVEVPETLVRVGVARFNSLDVSGSWIENKMGEILFISRTSQIHRIVQAT